MSVLGWPRLNFRGIFRTNPCTSNNDDVMPDVVDRDTNTLGSSVAGMDDAEVMAFFRQKVCMANYGDTAPCVTFMRSGWNLYGDAMTNFDATTITSYVDENGNTTTDPSVEPLIGTTFKLLGAKGDGSFRRADPTICDLDPTGLVTTQLFIGGAGFFATDGDYLGGWDHDTRAFQDWLNFCSTVGPYSGEQNFVGIGCMFQFSIPAVVCAAHAATAKSATLKTLLLKGADGDGIAVRFQVFECEPAITDGELYEVFKTGQGIGNPAFGYVIGTIGALDAGEPQTEPAGRKLSPPYPRPDMYVGPPPGTPGSVTTIPGCPLAWQGPPALFGNVVVYVRENPAVLTLDLLNAFPKWGFRNPSGPPVPYDPNNPSPGFQNPFVRGNVGQLALVCDTVDQGTIYLGTLDYGLDDIGGWIVRGGLQDIPYQATLYDAICSGTLRIVGVGGLNVGTSVLTEDVIRLITDDRGVYISGPGQSAQVTVRVYDRGGPLTQYVFVGFQEYANIIQTDAVATSCPDCNRPNQTTEVRTGLTPPPTGLNRLQVLVDGTPATGVVLAPGETSMQVTLQGVNAGAALLNYQLGTYVMDPSVPAWSTQVYSSVRVFTQEDYSAVIEAGNIPWDLVYSDVLRYYYLLFPYMSTFFPLNLPSAVARYGDLIVKRLGTPDDPVFLTSQNMPATHTMSPSKVNLVRAWIAEQGGGATSR